MVVPDVAGEQRADESRAGTLAPDPTGLPTLAALIGRHGAAVRQTAYRVTRSDSAAQEITQEVFMKAWTRGGYDPARGPVDGWLRVLSRSMAVEWVRREAAQERRLMRIGPSYAVGHAPLSEDQVADEEQASRVRAAVAQLPTAERQAVSLAYFAGLTYRQVADRLGRPEGTVKSQIRRALTRLASSLDVGARDVATDAALFG